MGSEIEKVELHPKGYINIFFHSLEHIKGKEAKQDQKEKKEEEKKTAEQEGTGTTNLQEYFDEMIPLGQNEGLAHSYEVRVELALYSEEKDELFRHYF